MQQAFSPPQMIPMMGLAKRFESMTTSQTIVGHVMTWVTVCRGKKSTTYSLSMIGDAMSKWKTTVPHLAGEPKSLDSQGNRLQYSLTASKIHGLCNVADWQYGGQFQGPGSGCNFSCSVILANLHLVEEMTGEIPRHFKLQMDNCAKDNKNKWLSRDVVESQLLGRGVRRGNSTQNHALSGCARLIRLV